MLNTNKAIITPETEHRFHNFILFEPSSFRLSDDDILFIGPEVKNHFVRALEKVSLDSSLKSQIICNRISKIGQMLNLVKDDAQPIMTKFFDNVWKRYNFVSNLGEFFLDYPTFVHLFPELKKKNDILITGRFDTSKDIDDDDDDDDDDDKTETEENETLAHSSEPVSIETP